MEKELKRRDHRSHACNLSSRENKTHQKYIGFNGIRTHDPYSNGAVLFQLTYQAN